MLKTTLTECVCLKRNLCDHDIQPRACAFYIIFLPEFLTSTIQYPSLFPFSLQFLYFLTFFFIFSHHLYFLASSPIFLCIFLIDLACLLIFYASHLFSIFYRLLFASLLRTLRKFLTSIPTFSSFSFVFFSCLSYSIF